MNRHFRYVLFDYSSLRRLYFSYDDTFIITTIDTSRRNDSIVYNEVSVERGSSNASVSMINNNVDRWVWPTVSNYILTNWYLIEYSQRRKSARIKHTNSGLIKTALWCLSI